MGFSELIGIRNYHKYRTTVTTLSDRLPMPMQNEAAYGIFPRGLPQYKGNFASLRLMGFLYCCYMLRKGSAQTHRSVLTNFYNPRSKYKNAIKQTLYTLLSFTVSSSKNSFIGHSKLQFCN